MAAIRAMAAPLGAAKGRRGYIGPLGDDFPAIFPIAMGLMVFFSAITLTYDYYNTKRDIALLMEANVALAKSARAQIVFDSDYWDSICDGVDKLKANYGVRANLELIELDGQDFSRIRKIGTDTLDNPCVDATDEAGNELPYPGDFFISLTYPVLVKTSDATNEPATLKVTAWV